MGSHAGLPFYLIDGYNVILNRRFESGWSRGAGTSRKESTAEAGRYLLLQACAVYVRKRRVKMTVVWDGGTAGIHPRSETKSGVQSIYTPRGMSADEQIVRMVEKRPNPRELTVVSDDRRHIIGIVRNLGAQTMSVGQFLALIGIAREGTGQRPRRQEDPHGGSDKAGKNDLSVGEWMRLFQVKNTMDREKQ
jgi:predicted RNA-binding protein with PIN domain